MALQEVTPEREPVGQVVNSIRARMLDIARMVKRPETYDEVLAEEAALWALWNDVGWIVSYLREEEERKRKAAPRIRIVQ
jgi:hypothetical protein